VTAIADPMEKEYHRLVSIKKHTAADRLAQRLLKLYTFLLDHVAKRSDAEPAQQIAIRRRVARCHDRLRQPAEALAHYEWLRTQVPIETAGDVLRGLALAYQATEQYDKAAEAWGTLSKGLPKRSDGWFEARHGLIQCHMKAGDVDHARKLMKLFRLVHAKIDSKAWAAEFDALGKELGTQ